MIRCVLVVLGVMLVCRAPAVEVDVSKRTTPTDVLNPNRGRIDPWLDPAKIHKVNEIVRKEHDLKVHVDRGQGQVSLEVTCRAKRATTFLFDDAQRIDVVILRGGKVAYRWSSNKRFVKTAGTSTVMPGESLMFSVNVPSGVLSGGGTVEARLTGYPEFTASAGL